MSPWLMAFKREYPHIVLDVLFENSVDDLMRNEVDIGVRIMSEPPQKLVARELGQVRYVVCASRSYAQEQGLPAHPGLLTDLPIISAAVTGRSLRLAAYQGDKREQVAFAAHLGLAQLPLFAAGGSGRRWLGGFA
jgi:DNA-binding transcriptional LysR family regulator